MARLFIEDKFFSSAELRIFTQIMKRKAKWPGLLSDGFMMRFWHDSQAKLTYRCDKGTLIKFISGYDETIEIEESVFLALLESGFVIEGGDDTYTIKGNEENVSRLQTYRDKQKRSVAARSKLPGNLPGNCQAICKTPKRQMTYAYAYASAYAASTPAELTSACDANNSGEKIEGSELTVGKTRADARETIIFDDLPLLEKKSLKKSRSVRAEKICAEDRVFAEQWAAITKAEAPWLFAKLKIDDYAKAVARIKRHLQISNDAMRFLMSYIESSDFWRKNAVSPVGVFKRSTNGCLKIDNIVLQMKRDDKRFGIMAAAKNIDWEKPIFNLE